MHIGAYPYPYPYSKVESGYIYGKGYIRSVCTPIRLPIWSWRGFSCARIRRGDLVGREGSRLGMRFGECWREKKELEMRSKRFLSIMINCSHLTIANG